MFLRNSLKMFGAHWGNSKLMQHTSANHLVYLFLASCSFGSEDNQCDLFHNGRLCSIESGSDVAGSYIDMESELDFQQECASNIECNYFFCTSG